MLNIKKYIDKVKPIKYNSKKEIKTETSVDWKGNPIFVCNIIYNVKKPLKRENLDKAER